MGKWESFVTPNLIKGFATSQSLTALPPSVASYLQNTRLSDGTVKARYGGASICAHIATGSFRGTASGALEGVERIWEAYATGGKTTIYESTDNGVTWASISPSSGPFGDTRLTDNGNPVAFSVVRDFPGLGLPAHDCLVIENGTDRPRVYAKSNGTSGAFTINTFGMAISYDIALPQNGAYITAGPTGIGFNVARTVAASNAPGFYFPSGEFAESYQAAPGDTVTIGIAVGSTNLSEPQIIIQLLMRPPIRPLTSDTTDSLISPGSHIFTPVSMGSINIGDILQIGEGEVSELVVVSAITGTTFTAVTALGHVAPFPILKQWVALQATPQDYKFSISDGVNSAVIWDPTGGTTGLLSFYEDSGTTGVPLDSHLYFIGCPTSPFASLVDLTQITSITATLINTHGAGADIVGGQAAAFVALLWGVYPSGIVPVGTSFSYGFGATDARGVGPTQVINNTTDLKASWPRFGGELTIGPTDPRFLLKYLIYGEPIPAPEVAEGINEVRIYMRQIGQSNQYLTDIINYAHYTGSWTVIGGSYPIEPVPSIIPTQDITYPDPQATVMTLPVGTTTEAANGRLYVGSSHIFYYSTFNNPFLFYAAIITDPVTNSSDPDSGGSTTYQGEIIKRIVALGAVGGPSEASGTPVTGVATLYILTDRSLKMLGGYDAVSLGKTIPVAPHGTFSPYSVAKNENRFYWLDDRLEIRVCEWGQVRALSLEIVDDLLFTIPSSRLQWVWGSCLNNRYFMGFTPTGQTTNIHALVYSEVRSSFESVDVPNGYTFESILSYYNQTSSKIQLLCSDAIGNQLIEHDQPGKAGDLSSSGVLFEIIPAYVKRDFNFRVDVRAIQALADPAAGGATLNTARLAVTRPQPFIDPPTNYDPNPVVGTISVPATGFTYGLDQDGLGIRDVMVQITLGGTVPGGWNLYAASVFVEEDTPGATRP